MAKKKKRSTTSPMPESSPKDPAVRSLDLNGDMIAVRHLRHFLAVVDNGHFGRAAEQLGISKQGISQSIAALEKSLGVRLFERGQFGAIPTDFGRVLTRHAMVMQAEIRNVRTEIEGLRQDHGGEITFALGSAFSEFIAPLAIQRFTKAYPGVELKIANVHPDNMLDLLQRGELDFVAMGDLGRSEFKDIERKPLFQMASNLLMSARHPLAKKSHIALEELAGQQFVGVWRSDLTERTLKSAFQEADIALPKTLECDNVLVTRGLLLDHNYLVVANRLFFERELAAGDVVERTVPGLNYTVSYVLFYRRGTIIGRATMALMREIQEVATERFGDSMIQISP